MQHRQVDRSQPGQPSVRFPEVARGKRMTQMGREGASNRAAGIRCRGVGRTWAMLEHKREAIAKAEREGGYQWRVALSSEGGADNA